MATYDRIVLLGSNGMLAQAFTEALTGREHTLVGFDRSECDIANLAETRRVLRDLAPTLVLNCAAYTNVDGAEADAMTADAVNGHGVGNIAEACCELNAKLVHFGTDFVFDGRFEFAPRPYTETDPCCPLSAYGRSKLLGERRLADVNPPGWLLLRTSWLYGATGDNFPRTMLRLAAAGKPLTVVNDHLGAPTYAGHLVEAALALIEMDATGTFHVCNRGQTTWFEFAREVLRQFGQQAEVRPIHAADWKAMRPASAVRPNYSVLDCSRLEAVLGRPMPTWQQGLHSFHDAIEPIQIIA